jgi:DNA-binding transcriptional MerR regulator
MYSVSTAGRLIADTIRSWEREGLFEARRFSNGVRYFTEEDIKLLRRVAAARQSRRKPTR